MMEMLLPCLDGSHCRNADVVEILRQDIADLKAENAKLRTDLSEIEDVAIDQQEGWQSVAVPYLPRDMWAYRKIENLAKIALGNDGSK